MKGMASLKRYLAELRDPASRLVVSRLANFSDLSPEDVEEFRKGWPEVDVARRRQVANRLTELAEDSFELDFDQVLIACLDDPDGEVRAKAIEGLWYSEEPALIDVFVRLLASDEVEVVRAAAASALGQFAYLGEIEELPASDARRVEQALLAAFNRVGEAEIVRRRALEAVGVLTRPVVEDLIRQSYQRDNLEFRASALFAMGRNCNRVWLPTVLKELGSPHPQLRFEAARACGELEAMEAVPRLIELLRDDDSEVRLCAAVALGKIGGPEAREALEQCLESADESMREAAQEAMEELDMWESLPGF
jgi:HEAT repeat protein